MDGARARTPPGEHGLTRGRPGLTPGEFRPPPALSGLKDAPPFRSRRLPGKGRSFPGRCHRRHGNAAILANGPRGAGLRGRGLVGRGRSMDGLFVEEVAASLVREFLSRKVRGAAPPQPWAAAQIWGRGWEPPRNFCAFGEGDLPRPAACPGGAGPKRHFAGPGELHFPGALSATAHFPPAGQDAAACAGICPGRGRGAAARSVLPAWLRARRRQGLRPSLAAQLRDDPTPRRAPKRRPEGRKSS